jgi:hypothetical protein
MARHGALPRWEAPLFFSYVGDCEDGEVGGMNGFGRGNRSTRRKPAPTPLCPPQIPLDQNRALTRSAAMGSQRLIASAIARPNNR